MIKCFCGCTELTEEEIKIIVMGTIDAFFNNKLGKQCFRSFMRIGNTNDEPYAITMINCYELSEKMLHNRTTRITENYTQLMEWCPNSDFEMELEEIQENGGRSDVIDSILFRLMYECKSEFGKENDYKRFKARMLEKIK